MKSIPTDHEAERYLLGYLMLVNKHLDIQKEDFYSIPHQEIFEAVEKVKGFPDIVSVYKILNKERNHLGDKALEYLAHLIVDTSEEFVQQMYTRLKETSAHRKAALTGLKVD